MNLSEVLLIVAVVLVMLAGVFHVMGKKTEAKWLLIIGVGIFLLLWALFKAIVEEMRKIQRPEGTTRPSALHDSGRNSPRNPRLSAPPAAPYPRYRRDRTTAAHGLVSPCSNARREAVCVAVVGHSRQCPSVDYAGRAIRSAALYRQD